MPNFTKISGITFERVRLASANHGKFVQILQKEVTNICSNCAQLIDLHIRSVTDLCNAMVSRKNNFLAKNTDFTHDCLGLGGFRFGTSHGDLWI